MNRGKNHTDSHKRQKEKISFLIKINHCMVPWKTQDFVLKVFILTAYAVLLLHCSPVSGVNKIFLIKN